MGGLAPPPALAKGNKKRAPHREKNSEEGSEGSRAETPAFPAPIRATPTAQAQEGAGPKGRRQEAIRWIRLASAGHVAVVAGGRSSQAFPAAVDRVEGAAVTAPASATGLTAPVR